MRLASLTSFAVFILCLSAAFISCGRPNERTEAAPSVQTQSTSLGDTVNDLSKNIDCIFQDQQGNHWFASNGGGVYRYNGKVLVNYTTRDGLVSNYVWTIQQDVHGIMWFSTRDGFSSFDGKTFTNRTFAIENAFTGNFKPHATGLLFPHKKGVCYYNGKSFINFTIHPASYTLPPNEASGPYFVYSTLIDRSGVAWFGTQSEGVCRYDGETISYLSDKDLAGPAVRTIYQDKRGLLWFGNNGGGLFRYDGKQLSNITADKNLGNMKFLREKKPVDMPGSLARVWAINEDNAGKLLIGTIDSGLWTFDGTTLSNLTTSDGLPGNSIWVIYKDRDGKMWMVTNGETVCQYDGKKFVKVEF
ncbi:MAG: two-component regulator propeller domain-containing protein [Bacteroidota bacterium]|jgi:ligand-binding sensor domain-containing protein